MSVSIEEFDSAIEEIVSAIDESNKRIVQSLDDTATAVHDHMTSWWHSLKTDLKEEMERMEKYGWPPSFIHVAGQGNLEKPFNRLMKWWTDINAEHGFAKKFLIELCDEIEFSEMKTDLMKPCCVFTRYSEEGVPGFGSRMPDLLVETPQAVLLLENKVGSGESGNDQYQDYLDKLCSNYKNKRCRAILCSRENLEGYIRERTEKGLKAENELSKVFYEPLTHEKLSTIFLGIAKNDEVPIWTRIAALTTCMSFKNDDEDYKKCLEAKQIWDKTNADGMPPQIEAICTLRTLLPLKIKDYILWEE